ncbi:hypothetical protein [Microbacterium paulum]
MSRVRVEIDLNSLRADGTTRVRLARANGKLERGQIVTAFESEDNVAALAMVDRVDERTGYAFLIVNRESMRDDDGRADYSFQNANQNRAVATVANQRAERASSGATVHQYALRRTASL